MENILKIALALLMLLCLFDMPYGFYQFVRFSGMIIFAILANNERVKSNNLMILFYGVSAILINPIFKITLGRGLWNFLDVVWAIVLVVTVIKSTMRDVNNGNEKSMN